MKRTREQLKADLMKKAEEQIDRLLEWEAKTDRPTLTQFENEVLGVRRTLSEGMLEALLTGQEARAPAARVVCPQCGQPMADKGLQTKVIETRVGTLRVKRQYYHCADCHVGLFPPG